MPFVQLIKEKMEVAGLSALNLTLDFNEFDVLKNNKEYLKNTLGVSKHYIIFFCLCFGGKNLFDRMYESGV